MKADSDARIYLSFSVPVLHLIEPMYRYLSVLVLMSVAAVTVNLIAVEPIPRPAKEKPNIILIMADDVSWEAFGCYGGARLQNTQHRRLGGARHTIRTLLFNANLHAQSRQADDRPIQL